VEYFKSFAEINGYFNECCWAVGADEAEIRVRLIDLEDYLAMTP
jgi:hypothetical protein